MLTDTKQVNNLTRIRMDFCEWLYLQRWRTCHDIHFDESHKQRDKRVLVFFCL